MWFDVGWVMCVLLIGRCSSVVSMLSVIELSYSGRYECVVLYMSVLSYMLKKLLSWCLKNMKLNSVVM